MISFDTETTGKDFRHGALPFFVTTCDEFDEHRNWIWEVDPYTRQPSIPQDELDAIFELINSVDIIALQNVKFDITAMGYCDKKFIREWPWKKTVCTLMAGHLLGSGYPHNLTSMVSQYLNVDIAGYENALKEAVQKARRMATKLFPEWMIAKEGLACMPSAKDEVWRNDYWLPRALVIELGYLGVTRELDRVNDTVDNTEHNWDKVLIHYSNADSYFTSKLWPVMGTQIQERDVFEIYHNVRMKMPEIALDMEERGVTLSAERRMKLLEEYREESQEAEAICMNIASDYIDERTGEPFQLTLPKSGRNDKLSRFIFDCLKLPVKKETKKGNPSLDKEALEQYVKELPPKTPGLLFVQKLIDKRKRDTAISYMDSYERYWIPVPGQSGYYTLHPNLNPTGTAHLRWSCDNPNEQNISKQKGFNLRWMFGPTPGREWWSLDAQNIELRIPVFEAGEKEIMDVFLRPNDPPYYGSYHLVIFDLLHPELFKKFGKKCKDEFESDWYQWVKNGNFAVIYGAQQKKADATYHVQGAFNKIRYRFPQIAKLSDRQIARANKTGGIETIPDKTVNPRRGYPIMCSRSDFGKVQPTHPLNYHVSGSACWWMNKGMLRCYEQLNEWRERDGFDGFITMQVHDELVFDMPASKGDVPAEWKKLKENPGSFRTPGNNCWRVKILQQLMEQGGDDIGIPTPVGVEYNPETWDKFVAI